MAHHFQPDVPAIAGQESPMVCILLRSYLTDELTTYQLHVDRNALITDLINMVAERIHAEPSEIRVFIRLMQGNGCKPLSVILFAPRLEKSSLIFSVFRCDEGNLHEEVYLILAQAQYVLVLRNYN